MNSNNIFFSGNPQNTIIDNSNVMKYTFSNVCSKLFDITNDNFNYILDDKLKEVNKNLTNQILELQEELTINMSDFDYSNDIKDLNDEINNIKKENEELRDMIELLISKVEYLENENNEKNESDEEQISL